MNASRGKLAMESNPAKELRRESDGLVTPEGGNKSAKDFEKKKDWCDKIGSEGILWNSEARKER